MDTPREIKNVKPQLYLVPALAIVVALWAWWLLENNTNVRLTRRFSGSTVRKEPVSHWVPLIGSPIVLLGSIIWWRRSAGVVANGVLVDAKIVNIGSAKGGLRDAELSYSVNGKYFRTKKSFSSGDLANYQPGDLIPIVADKRNPKRILINK